MPILTKFENCCKAKITSGFGEGSACLSYPECKRIIEGHIQYALNNNQVFLVATSTKCQKPLNKALKELGFKRTKYHKKSVRHLRRSTVVALWHLPLEEVYAYVDGKVFRKDKGC